MMKINKKLSCRRDSEHRIQRNAHCAVLGHSRSLLLALLKPVCDFLHCVSKTSTFLAITRESIDEFLQYLAEMLLRKEAVICCYISPPHLINASTLPCETENTEIVSFHVNVAC